MTEKNIAGKSGKWNMLVTGLAIGIAIGGAAMWWMENKIRSNQGITLYQYYPPDSTRQDLPIVDLSGQTSVDLSGPSMTEDSNLVSEEDNIVVQSENMADLEMMDTMDGIYFTPEMHGDEEAIDDYRQWSTSPDTSRHLSSSTSDPARVLAGDDAIVMRDELLFVRQIIILEEKQQPEGNLQQKPVVNKPLRVEFWKSPINYQGYKMTDSKLVLFGIYAIDSVQLIRKDDLLWLSVMEDRYQLGETYEFKPLINARILKSKQPKKPAGK